MVLRRERTVEDYQQEVKEKDVRIQQLETELARMRAQGGGSGITGLIAARVMRLDDKGMMSKDISEFVSPSPDNALVHGRISSYRIDTPRKEDGEPVVRVAVAVQLKNPGTAPWMPGGAALVVKGQEGKELKPWPPEPILPKSDWRWVVVETELTEREARGTYTLELWDESGSRLVSLRRVTFP
ncbi:DUF2381 family protein [Archangium sp.]|uniref:DUF2381 family protein n=1 Tax=Archangium sp. TaxID=1872627 RepID=UPI0039C85F00